MISGLMKQGDPTQEFANFYFSKLSLIPVLPCSVRRSPIWYSLWLLETHWTSSGLGGWFCSHEGNPRQAVSAESTAKWSIVWTAAPSSAVVLCDRRGPPIRSTLQSGISPFRLWRTGLAWRYLGGWGCWGRLSTSRYCYLVDNGLHLSMSEVGRGIVLTDEIFRCCGALHQECGSWIN